MKKLIIFEVTGIEKIKVYNYDTHKNEEYVETTLTSKAESTDQYDNNIGPIRGSITVKENLPFGSILAIEIDTGKIKSLQEILSSQVEEIQTVTENVMHSHELDAGNELDIHSKNP